VSFPNSSARHRAINFSSLRRAPRVLAGVLSILLIASGLSLGAGGVAADAATAAPSAHAANSLGSGVLSLSKTAGVTTAQPGDNFVYTLNFGCSSTTTGCVNAVVTDPVPAPLTVVGTPTVVGAGTATVAVSGNTVTVSFADAVPNTVPASTGLAAGTTGSIMVQVQVPAGLAKSYDGQVLTNTANFTSSNSTTVTSSAPVTLQVPPVVSETVTKSWAAGPIIFNPGATSTVTLTAQNSSNISASSVSLIEPSDSTASSSVFNFYDLASLGAVTFPAGADRVQAIATVGGIDIAGPVGTTAVLDSSVSPGDVTALQFVFTSSSSAASITSGGAAGSVALTLAQRATNRTPPSGTLASGGGRVNTVGGHVVTPQGEADATPVSKTQTVSALTVAVTAQKTFTPSDVPAGLSSLAVITATNTSTGPLTSMTVGDPTDANSFFTADIGFGGFVAGSSQWPAGATAGTVQWFTNTGSVANSSFTAASNLPSTPTLSTGQYITGFLVSYTGPVNASAAAKIAYTVTTDDAAGPSGTGFLPYTNGTTVTGVNQAGSRAVPTTADLNVYFPQVKLDLVKTISPATVFPGGSSLVQLAATTPNGTSSVRPTSIVVSDVPTAPTATDYWNAFTVVSIAATTVPAGATMLTEYTLDGGQTWKTLRTDTATTTAVIVSGAIVPTAPASASDITGMRFTFTYASGFGQGTTVKPALTFAARKTLRSDGVTTTSPGGYPTITSYTNCGTGAAAGVTASGTPVSASANNCQPAGIEANDGGPGTSVATKKWDATTVNSQSRTSTGVKLGWGTYVSGMGTVAVQDPAVESPVTANAYQEFNITRIDGINPTTASATQTLDPLIKWDKVTKVELYDGAAGVWRDITSIVCPTSATCDGTFPGYAIPTTGTTNNQATTAGVRLTFGESPNRGARITSSNDPTAPAVGSGVASASPGSFPGPNANARTIHLVMQLRDQVRNSSPVAWVTQTGQFNVAGSAGVVDNSVLVSAAPQVPGNAVTATATDHISLLDPTLTLNTAKTVTPTTLVIPQPDIADSAYPTSTYTTKGWNSSATNIWQLRLTDPSTCSNPSTQDPCVFGAYVPTTNVFERENLTHIALSLVGGVQSSLTVVSLLHRDSSGTLTTTSVSAAAAVLLDSTALADVVGVSVMARGTNVDGADGTGGSIAPATAAAPNVTMTLTTQLRSTTRSGNAALTAGTIANTVNGALWDDVLLPASPGTAASNVNVTLANGNLAITTSKSIAPSSILEPASANPVTVTLNAGTTAASTVSPKILTVTDAAATFWNAFTLNSFTLPAPPTGADRVLIEAQTGTGSSAVWNGTADAPQVIPFVTAFHLPTGVAASDVTGLRFTFTKSDGTSFSASNVGNQVALIVGLRSTLRDGSGPVTSSAIATAMPGETVAGTVTDTVTAIASYNTVVTPTMSGSATFSIAPGTTAVAVEKTTPGQAAAGKVVPFSLKFKNTGTGYLVNPVITDTLPSDGSLLFVPTDVPAFSTTTGGLLPTDSAVIVRSYNSATGVIRFTWPTGSKMAPGESYAITLNLQIKPGAAPTSTATNTFGVTSDRTMTSANCTKLNSSSTRAVSFATNTCSTTNVVTTLSQGSFTAAKGAKGSSGTAQNVVSPTTPCTADTDGYYRYPCAANSVIGGTDSWKLDLVNGGNVSAATLAAVDVFPYQNDVGVIDASSRGSVFAPRFNGDVALSATGAAAGATMTWFVTTDATPCIKDITPGAGSCTSAQWHPSSDLASTIAAADVTGIKLVFSFAGITGGKLPGGAALKVTYSTTNIPSTSGSDGRAPVAASVTPANAWNSFAFYPTYSSGTQPSGAQEPIKAGIQLNGGPIQISKIVTGPAAQFAPTSFTADVGCTVAGAPVDLGSSSSVVLNTANSFSTRIDGIPEGAQCAVTERGSNGSYGESARSVSPASAVITVAAASDPVPAAQKFSLTNDYGSTSLTVTKHVDTLATVGSFGPFSFTLACTTLGGQTVTLAAADAAFDLADGASRTVSALPVGATCALNETDADGAADSPNTVAIALNGGTATAGTSAPLLLASSANTAVVTNHYAAGTIAVTKTVDGTADSATFGAGPFTVAVRCVYDGTQVLYDNSFSIVGGQTVALVPVFPVGTLCSTSETTAGGATSTTIDQPSVAVVGPTGSHTVGLVNVVVTNTFVAGTVQVTKARTGDFATYGAGPFTAQVVCSWDKDGTTLTIPLSGGGVVVLDSSNGYTATVSGLIQGAHCDTTETVDGGATSTTIAPIGGVTVPANSAAAVTITNDFDTSSLRVDKVRTGPGASQFGAGPFTVEVTCSYLKDGQVTAIDLGSNAQFALSSTNSYTKTITGLIVGADCMVVETDNGMATATSADPANGIVTILAGSAPTVVTITNYFDVGHLSLKKTVNKPNAVVGDEVVYTIVLTNDGQIDATNRIVTDKLPTGLGVISSDPVATTVGTDLQWHVPFLAIGHSLTFTVTAVVQSIGMIKNAATVSQDPGPWQLPTYALPCDPNFDASCAGVMVHQALAFTGVGSLVMPIGGGLIALFGGLGLLALAWIGRRRRADR
jgi:uncharacterized repeat protein (TIGR01451 family)/fimbrial isopeptide formation D2 family protein